MRTLGMIGLVSTLLLMLLAAGCSSGPEVRSGHSAFKASRAPASVSSSLPTMNWQCVQASNLIGKWEIQIQDVEAHFIYQPNLYPGTEQTDVVLKDPEAKQIGKVFEFSSDQLDLTIKTNKKVDVCPVEGETCFQAKLGRIDLEALGPELTKELTSAKWSCAPRDR